MVSSDSSDERPDEEEDVEEPEEEPEVESRTQASLSTFEAAPPTREEAETLDVGDVTPQAVKRYMLPNLQKVHVKQLRWDLTGAWGQIRGINEEMVAHYLQELRKDPPMHCIRILTRNMGSGLSN